MESTVLTGARLGPYELLARIGAGGMGEVYRAIDTRLDRMVAIKVLRPDSCGNPNTRLRVQHEIRAISNTSHPHVCALYDVGHEAGVDFLVMELLHGETLAHRLRKGPLPIEQVLRIGCDIASAIGHVHKQGFVHRDVKPSNIMLTGSGAKLFDFGIAKTVFVDNVPCGQSDERSNNPHTLTLEGTLVGTVQYMAPEQLEGFESDARTDIFGCGIVLYEMAFGHRPFVAATTASTIAAIWSSEPQPFDVPPFGMSRAFERTVRKCLAKNPDDRWQNVDDLKSELEWILQNLRQPDTAAPQREHKPRRAFELSVVAGVAIAALLGAWTVLGRARPLRDEANGLPIVRFLAQPPSGNREIYFGLKTALSPDGRYLVSATQMPDGRKPLWLRPLASTAGFELDGTDGANYPFWPPDSASIGFFAAGQLKAIDVTGGSPRVIGQDPSAGARGATWNRDGVLVVGSDRTGLFRMPAAGGPAVPLTTLDVSLGEFGHTLPQFLPDDRHFIFLVRSSQRDRSGIYLASLDAPQKRQRILDVPGEARYASGYVIFSRDRALFAQRFDTATLALSGAPLRIGDSVAYNAAGGRTGFSVSQNGVLAYQARTPTELIWFDRAGTPLGSIADGDFDDPVVSPDGTRIAVTKLDPHSGKRSIWVSGPSRFALRRFEVSGSWNEVAPVWSPRSDRIVFASDRDGQFQLYVRSVETGEEELFLKSAGDKWPLDWSPDGRFVLFRGGSGPGELWSVPVSGERRPVSLSTTDPILASAKISPDGKWLAYVTPEVGAGEVFVRPFPFGEPKYQISSGGGGDPRWRSDGRELFYLTPNGTLMSVPVNVGRTFELVAPVPLFRTRAAATVFIGAWARNQYDSADNGHRFLVSQPYELISSSPMTVVLNWPAALRGK